MKNLFSTFFLIFACSFLSVFAQNKEIDSLKITLTKFEALPKFETDTNYINTLNELAAKYQGINSDTMLILSENALALSKQNHYEKGQVEALRNKGIAFRAKGDYAEALKMYFEALPLAEKIGYKKGIAKLYNNMAIIYQTQGKYPEALETHFKALRIREEIGDKQGIAASLNNIALIYQSQGKYPEALDTHFKSLKISEEIGNKQGIAASLTNMAVIYQNQGKYPEALETHFKSLKICEEIGNKQGIATSLTNMAAIYMNQGKYPEALKAHLKALKIFEGIGNKQGIAEIKNGLAQTYLALKNYAPALQYAKEGLEMAKEIGAKDKIRDINKTLSKIYEATGKTDKALLHYKQFKSYADSINNYATTKSIEQLQLQYEYDKKETLLTATYEKKTLEKNWLIFAMSVGVVSLVIIVLSISINRRKLQKAYEKLDLAKSEIQLQKEAIQEKVVELDLANQTKNKLFSVIGHDLKSPLATLKGVLDLISTDNISMEEFKQLSAYLNQSTATLLDTLDNLLQWSYAQMKGTSTNQQQVDFAIVIEEQITLLMPTAKHKKITLKQEIIAPIVSSADLNQMRLVLRNLIGNALKFTPEAGTIILKAQIVADFIEIIVIDTGIGMNEKTLQNLFVAPTSTLGTHGEKGTGLGLRLCKEFVEGNGGELMVTSTERKGSTFKIVMPNLVNM